MIGSARRNIALAIVIVAVGASIAAAMRQRGHGGRGPVRAGLRPRGPALQSDRGAECPVPPPLERSSLGCDAPDRRVLVPAAAMALGPSDWEAEGRVPPRTVRAEAFRIDAFEVTRGRYARAEDGDVARAASAMTRAEAASFCEAEGGRLPSEDEWIVAAASAQITLRRYPWGDTGAVCRRAAWGLLSGPCAESAGWGGREGSANSTGADEGGPDTVGAHPDGDSPLGLHDMAGNVAEWVAPETARPELGIAKGGSWQSALASDLRIWARLELDPEAKDSRVGLRCVYPP